jgi:hypothetical protein
VVGGDLDDRRRFYELVVEYLGQVGCSTANKLWDWWLTGRGLGGIGEQAKCTLRGGRMMSWWFFNADPAFNKKKNKVREFLLQLVNMPECTLGRSDRHRWMTSAWPRTACMIAAVGYIQLCATIECKVTSVARELIRLKPIPRDDGSMSWLPVRSCGEITCKLEWEWQKRFDWNPGKSIPCLPFCDLGVPIEDAWAASISHAGKDFYNLTVHLPSETFRLPCPQLRFGPPPAGPADDPMLPPVDWREMGLGCMWGGRRP